MLDGVDFGGPIADKALHSDAVVADLDARGSKGVISQHPRRTRPPPLDRDLCKRRRLIETCFGRPKEFKRIAMRADQPNQSFPATIQLAAAVINPR